jgi:hypothetical protein
MHRTNLLLAFLIALILPAVLLAQTPQAANTASGIHDKKFWRSIVDAKFAVPQGSTAPELSSELVQALASTDPELRDDLAYSILTAWIYQTRALTDDDVRTLSTRLIANLSTGGPSDEDVVRRSFSTLILSIVAARDNAQPFLTKQEFDRIFTAATTYLTAEHDVRGFDPKVGWIHSAAHTSDLLKFLARGRYLQPAQQSAMLKAVQQKLATSPVLTFGEDERMSRAVLSLIRRSDFDQSMFKEWSNTAMPKLPEQGEPTLQQLNARQNGKNCLSKLAVILWTQSKPSEHETAALELLRSQLDNQF